MRCLLILFLFFFICPFSYSQANFSRNSSIIILNQNGDTLKNPWLGGFNAPQFSEIDLNLDGINDLFVFDRTGNKVSTFINSGQANQISYTHDASFSNYFPENLHDWVLLRDFNCDGKIDIFTSNSGGIAVYKNTSTTQLSFVLEMVQLLSDNQPDSINPSFINLFVGAADIPAIDDIDGDGDLDILISSLIGNRIEYHKNLSIEKYGICDSLDYQIRNRCWGFVKESTTQNKVTFFDTCSNNIASPEKIIINNDKHVGGTSMFTLDVDANNNKDLVLGGYSYDNLLLLINDDVTPNLTASSISNQQSDFPAQNLNTIAVDIEHFPAGYYLDVNNDGVKDLVAATNSTNFAKDHNNVWLYQNNNLTDSPDFSFQTQAFMQEDMIEIGEGSNPQFFDYNADGLIDFVVGNHGYYDSGVPEYYVSSLWLYENIGTASSPRFKLVDSNFANISSIDLDLGNVKKTLGLAPTFGDIDGDGDIDMMIGDYIGYIHYFENIAGPGNPVNFVLNQARYAGIDVGYEAMPQLIDLNRDLKLDLIIGKETGYVSYFENTGTTVSPIFSLITDSLGTINTKRFGEFKGNSAPFVYDDGGNYRMIVGSNSGYLYEYSNIDGNLTGTFSEDSTFLNIWEGVRSTVSLMNINNDNYYDMLIGNYAGGLSYYNGTSPLNVASTNKKDLEIKVYPNPFNSSITIDLDDFYTTNSSIEILDLLGKSLVIQPIKNKKIIIDLSSYSKGIYLIKFNNNEGIYTKKIIKK